LVGAALRRCLRSVLQPLPLRAVLSSDRAALGPLNDRADQRVRVDFDRRPAANAGECAPSEPDHDGGGHTTVPPANGDGEPLPATPPAADDTVVIPDAGT
jgi:hypothetical protein